MADEVEVRGAGTRITSMRLLGLDSDEAVRIAAVELAIMASEGTVRSMKEDYTSSLLTRAKAIELYIRPARSLA